MATRRPRLRVHFSQRDFGREIAFPDLTYQIERYAHMAIGGPKDCVITAKGPQLEIERLVSHIQAPLVIEDDRNVKVWWGFLNTIRPQQGKIEDGISLDGMRNRVAVRYSYRGAGQTEALTPGITSFSSDTDSVNTYGKAEYLGNLTDTSPSDVLVERDKILDLGKLPQAASQIREAEGEIGVTIECLGWIYMLNRVYYAQDGATESYTDKGEQTQSFSQTSANQEVAQSFTVSNTENIEVSDIDVWLAKVGSPGSDVTVALYTDSASAPDTLIDSGTIAEADILTGEPLPFTATLGATQTLVSGTTYWIRLSAGGVNPSNYYIVAVNEGLGYSGGVFRLYNGSTWDARSPDADMPFVVQGEWAHKQQIEKLIEEADPGVGSDIGAFFNGYYIPSTGLSSTPYRNGRTKALTELKKLLRTSNNKRLLVNVTPERYIEMEEEPDAGDSDYFLLLDGTIEDEFGQEVQIHECPHGIWVVRKDLVSVGTTAVDFANLSHRFIEEAEYDVRSHSLRIRTRGARDPFDLAISD